VRVGERLGLEDGGVERAVEQDLSHGSLVSSSSLSEQQQRRPAEAEQSHAGGRAEEHEQQGSSRHWGQVKRPRADRAHATAKRTERKDGSGASQPATEQRLPAPTFPGRGEQSNRGWGAERI
jgi:hypothetical protein